MTDKWTGEDHHGRYRVDPDGTTTREAWGGYRVVSDPSSFRSHETLVAPDGTEVATLGEPEDRIFSRDLSPLVARLAAAEQDVERLRAQARRWEDKEVARAVECCGAEERAKAAEAEVERLRKDLTEAREEADRRTREVGLACRVQSALRAEVERLTRDLEGAAKNSAALLQYEDDRDEIQLAQTEVAKAHAPPNCKCVPCRDLRGLDAKGMERLSKRRLAAESREARYREALAAAASSLEWIAGRKVAGGEDHDDVMWELRDYARSRAGVARALLSPEFTEGSR